MSTLFLPRNIQRVLEILNENDGHGYRYCCCRDPRRFGAAGKSCLLGRKYEMDYYIEVHQNMCTVWDARDVEDDGSPFIVIGGSVDLSLFPI